MSDNNIQTEVAQSMPSVNLKLTADGTETPVSYQTEGDANNQIVFLEPQPGVRVYLETFGGANKGLSYHYVQFEHEKPETAIEQALSKYGAERVLNLINTGLKNFTVAKVRNSKLKAIESACLDEKGNVIESALAAAIENVRQNNPIIFTAQEAYDYSPMQREETFQSLVKKANAAQKAGDFDTFMKLMNQAMATVERQKALADAVKA